MSIPTGIITDQRRRSAQRHADRKYTCVCGKMGHGNGFVNHLKHCEQYLAYRYQRGRPMKP